ncbi:hypothetical protein HK101_010137 [Irineochytrium annulatum]|nr:hypothetical protein HK101_010137 [Irineochytrium annulatum]
MPLVELEILSLARHRHSFRSLDPARLVRDAGRPCTIMISILLIMIASAACVAALHKAPIHISHKQPPLSRPHAHHRDAAQALSSRATAATDNIVFGSLDYTVPVTLVQTGQQFNLQLDTGSADSWILGTLVDLEKGQKQGLRDLGSPIEATYHRGAKLAHVQYSPFQGTIKAGNKATAKKFYFGVSVDDDGDPNIPGSDGVLGLGFDSASKISHYFPAGNGSSSNFIDQLALDPDVFGIYLPPKNATDGEITFGGANADRYTGTPQCLPLSDSAEGYWSFSVQKASWEVATSERSSILGTGNLDDVTSDAVIDSSSSIIYLDPMTAKAINQIIMNTTNLTRDASGNQLYDIDCGIADTGPDVRFNIGDLTLVIPPSAYVLPFVDDSCLSGFAIGTYGDYLRFGGVLLTQYCKYDWQNRFNQPFFESTLTQTHVETDTIYDRTNNQTCFAVANRGSAASPATATTESATESSISLPTETSTDTTVSSTETSTTSKTITTSTETMTESSTQTSKSSASETTRTIQSAVLTGTEPTRATMTVSSTPVTKTDTKTDTLTESPTETSSINTSIETLSATKSTETSSTTKSTSFASTATTETSITTKSKSFGATTTETSITTQSAVLTATESTGTASYPTVVIGGPPFSPGSPTGPLTDTETETTPATATAKPTATTVTISPVYSTTTTATTSCSDTLTTTSKSATASLSEYRSSSTIAKRKAAEAPRGRSRRALVAEEP